MIVHRIRDDGSPREQQRTARDAKAHKFAELFRSGMTLAEIGDANGLTRERIRQLLSNIGVTRIEGGQAIKAAAETFRRAHARNTKLDAQVPWLNVTKREALELNGGISPWTKGTPVNAFIQQKRNAHFRGIQWNMTFVDWWGIWRESGKWSERGRGYGYCMARWGDSGDYSASNVHICTSAENVSESYLVKPWDVRHPGHERNAGVAVWINKNSRKPFQLVIAGKYHSCHVSREAALAHGAAIMAGEKPVQHPKPFAMSVPCTPIGRAVSIVGSRSELARRIGVPRQSVQKWVNGSKLVPKKHVNAIERVTGVSRHDLRPDIFGKAA